MRRGWARSGTLAGSMLLAAATGYAPAVALAGDALDPDYVAWLAGECAACHAADGAHHNIPMIHGGETGPFIAAMTAYRDGARDNAVMRNIALPLGTDEIAALAEYFRQPPDP